MCCRSPSQCAVPLSPFQVHRGFPFVSVGPIIPGLQPSFSVWLPSFLSVRGAWCCRAASASQLGLGFQQMEQDGQCLWISSSQAVLYSLLKPGAWQEEIRNACADFSHALCVNCYEQRFYSRIEYFCMSACLSNTMVVCILTSVEWLLLNLELKTLKKDTGRHMQKTL